MTSDATQSTTERSRLLSALIGAGITVVTAFVPLSPVLGGAVAGYLRQGDEREGLRVGALAGLFAAIPVVLAATLFASFFMAFPGGLGFPRAAVLMLAMMVMALLVGGLYTVGLSALGGWIAVGLLGDGTGPDVETGPTQRSDPDATESEASRAD